MEKNMENRYGDEEFEELVKVVEASESESAIILLKFLLNPKAFEVFDDMVCAINYFPLVNIVMSSSSEKALSSLVSLLTEQQYSDPIIHILEEVVEKKISSINDLKGIGEIIKKAISEGYVHGDMYGNKDLR